MKRFIFPMITLMIFGSEAWANTTSVAEYDTMPLDEQFQVVRSALGKIYDYYSVTQPDAEKAACMIELFNNPDSFRQDAEVLNGYSHFLLAVSFARESERPEAIFVEQILLNVVDQHCGAVEN